MPRQENTKEKIIECAFSLFEKPRMSDISLGEIAAKVGISKTAFFRHYKNKEELVEKMRERFFEAFAEMVSQLEPSRPAYNLKAVSKAVHCVFDFNEKYPNYLSYFLQMSFSDQILDEGMNLILLDNGINILHDDIFKDKNKFSPRRMVPNYFEQTLLSFLFLAFCKNSALLKIADFEKYKQKVADLIYNGLGKKNNPISPERKKELDKICEIQLESDKKSNRFFNAFVDLLQESKSSRITVKKIAEALGMSQSSVYSFFTNKSDYMANMLLQETERAGGIIKERCAAAKNSDEAIYIMMRSEANYFALRPQVIALHGFFIIQEAAFSASDFDGVRAKTMEMSKNYIIPDGVPNGFDFPVSDNATLFIKWISGLTVAFMMLGTRHNFPPEWLDFYVSTVYEMIQCGIKKLNKDGE